MVMLAFARAASIIVLRNPGAVTGGEEGPTTVAVVVDRSLARAADEGS